MAKGGGGVRNRRAAIRRRGNVIRARRAAGRPAPRFRAGVTSEARGRARRARPPARRR